MQIDATALGYFRTCPSLYYERIVLGLESPFTKPALSFGGIVHVGLATLLVEQSLNVALKVMAEKWEGDPPDDYRTLGNAQRVVTQWDKEWTGSRKVVELGGKPLVEWPLVFPTGKYVNCLECDWGLNYTILSEGVPCCENCGADSEEIEYGGILDWITEDNFPTTYVVDHKTTSRLGETFHDQFTPNCQMTGYRWLTKKLLPEARVEGPIINALCLTEGSRITIAPPHLLSRTQWQMDKWMEGVVETCNAIKRCERSGVWARNDHACVGRYGSCPFRMLHSMPDADSEQQIRESRYVEKRWDFLQLERA